MSWRLALAFVFAIATTTMPAATQSVAPAQARDAGRLGWDAIREGRHQDAAHAFARALDVEPRDPSLHLGAGLASFLLGQSTAARLSLERALSLAPSLTPASLLLGDLLYKNSDIAGAIQVYEAALRHAPDDKTLHSRLDALRREAALHDRFFASHGSHFTVLFEGPADETLAARAIEMLEAGYWRIATALAAYPENVITVVLYTQEQFRDITRSPQWAAGAYDGRIRVPVRGSATQARELERVLVHELTHAFVQSIAPRGIPVWLHEGLAVMFEPDAASSGAIQQLPPPEARIPLERLAGSFAALSTGEARLAYTQSAAIVRAMFDLGGPGAVGALLQDIARGEPFAAAFERQFFTQYATFFESVSR